MRRLGLGLGLGGGGGSAITPVLSDFGSGSIDDLELDPPAIFIEHNTTGTLTGDFHSSATPPAKEAGDIGFFTTSLSGDAVTDISTALNTFLDLHPGETGYLHFRLTNGAGDSNVITTQQITAPGEADILVNGSFATDTDWTKGTGWAITGGQAVATSSSAILETTSGVPGLVTGQVYKMTIEIASITGTLQFGLAGASQNITVTTPGTHVVYLTARGQQSNRLRIQAVSGTTCAIDSISLAVPNLTLGADLVTNGTFAADTNWTKFGTASISGGVGNLPANGDQLTQTITMTSGDLYLAEFDFTITTGQLSVLMASTSSGSTSALAIPIDAAGSIQVILPAGASNFLRFVNGASATGLTIDNVTLKKVL